MNPLPLIIAFLSKKANTTIETELYWLILIKRHEGNIQELVQGGLKYLYGGKTQCPLGPPPP